MRRVEGLNSILIGSLLAGCSVVKPPEVRSIEITSTAPGRELGVTVKGFGQKFSAEIQKGARQWHDKYECIKDITVMPLLDLPDDLEELLTSDTTEMAIPGEIFISPDATDPNDIVRHAMTHACVPKEETVLPETLLFSGGLLI